MTKDSLMKYVEQKKNGYRFESIDKITLRIPAKYIDPKVASKEEYTATTSNFTCLKWGLEYYHIVFHDDVFDYDLKLLDCIKYTIDKNRELDESIFKQNFDWKSFLIDVTVFEFEYAFDFPDYSFMFYNNPHHGPFRYITYKRDGVTLYSKDNTADKQSEKNNVFYEPANYKKKSFVKIYDRTKRLRSIGKKCEKRLTRFEYLLREREFEKMHLSDLNYRMNEFKKRIKPTLVKYTKKYLKSKYFFIHDTFSFKCLHPYLYKVMIESGCGPLKASQIKNKIPNKSL